MQRTLARWQYSLGMAAFVALNAPRALAQVFDGPGLEGGVDAARDIKGPITGTSLRDTVIKALAFILDFLALAATVMIIAAGAVLIVSMGNEEAKNKAKAIVKYVIFGLVLILFARFIVSFFTVAVPTELN